jgi:general secretion pathway protein M
VTPALAQRLNPLRERAQAAWSQLAPRERAGMAAAGAALLLLVLVMGALQPALRTLREAPAQRAQVEAALAQMQRDAAEVQRLRALPAVNPPQAAAALQAATQLLGPEAKLSLQGDRAVLEFSNLDGERLGAWLAEVRSAARAKPLEAQLQRGERGYGGRILLQLSAAAPG